MEELVISMYGPLIDRIGIWCIGMFILWLLGRITLMLWQAILK